MVAALFGSVFAYGAAIGDGYDGFVERNGSIPNVAARLVGFGLDVITVTGQRELSYMEILAASGLSGRDSLPFLDAREVREQVMKIPLVREASVRKLYPDRLVIEVVEREAHALWQRDGEVFVISADGVPIDNLRDDRFVHLPFVVGDGANERVAEFQKILEAAGELRSRIRAGVLVTNRRWNVQLVTGVDVKLPEIGAEQAIAALAQLSRDERILDKDLISIDMRIPGRLVARLTEEASAVREANRKPRRRGA
jgi:cell division protein FtsQ